MRVYVTKMCVQGSRTFTPPAQAITQRFNTSSSLQSPAGKNSVSPYEVRWASTLYRLAREMAPNIACPRQRKGHLQLDREGTSREGGWGKKIQSLRGPPLIDYGKRGCHRVESGDHIILWQGVPRPLFAKRSSEFGDVMNPKAKPGGRASKEITLLRILYLHGLWYTRTQLTSDGRVACQLRSQFETDVPRWELQLFS